MACSRSISVSESTLAVASSNTRMRGLRASTPGQGEELFLTRRRDPCRPRRCGYRVPGGSHRTTPESCESCTVRSSSSSEACRPSRMFSFMVAGDNKHILHHQPDLFPQPMGIKPAQVDSIQADDATAGVVEAFEKVDEGGLPGTGSTHNCQGLPRPDRHGQVFDNLLVRLVGKIHPREGDFTPERLRGQAVQSESTGYLAVPAGERSFPQKPWRIAQWNISAKVPAPAEKRAACRR